MARGIAPADAMPWNIVSENAKSPPEPKEPFEQMWSESFGSPHAENLHFVGYQPRWEQRTSWSRNQGNSQFIWRNFQFSRILWIGVLSAVTLRGASRSFRLKLSLNGTGMHLRVDGLVSGNYLLKVLGNNRHYG